MKIKTDSLMVGDIVLRSSRGQPQTIQITHISPTGKTALYVVPSTGVCGWLHLDDQSEVELLEAGSAPL